MLIQGGQALISDLGGRCSIGTCGVDPQGQTYVITAGHTGGTRWFFHGGELGSSAKRCFRPMDCRSVLVENGQATALVFEGVAIQGFQDAELGLPVIRVGAKSGWTQGVVTHLDQEQCYDLGGPLRGLIRTDIETRKGDSGGPVITVPVHGVSRLVGFVSGGGSSRTKGPATLAQPAREAFEALGLEMM